MNNTEVFIQKITDIKKLIINNVPFNDDKINAHIKELDDCFLGDYSEIVDYFKTRYTELEELAGDEGIPDYMDEELAEVSTFIMFLEYTALDEKIIALLTGEDFDDNDDDISIDNFISEPIKRG